MIDKIKIGSRISRLRKTIGLSQAEFSELLNVSPQAVSKWETGASLPDIDILLNMSWIFKASINSILEGDEYFEEVLGMERGYLFLNKILTCPSCREKLTLDNSNDELLYQCKNHKYPVIDGVVDFKTREISGEQWSLSYRNYDEYLHEHHWKRNPAYDRGLNEADVIWEEIKKRRPKIILDMACGTGQGIKQQIKRINWPVTIIMVDISHRILKWDKTYYLTEWNNPFVDMVYLACDGSNLPIADNSVDMVLSNWGYESMQAKIMEGFREAYRVLNNNGCTVYNKSIIESYENDNSKKWIKLLLSSVDEKEVQWWKSEFVDIKQWITKCENTGFKENIYTKIYGEIPAPDTDVFPYENEMAQWMAEFVCTSIK